MGLFNVDWLWNGKNGDKFCYKKEEKKQEKMKTEPEAKKTFVKEVNTEEKHEVVVEEPVEKFKDCVVLIDCGHSEKTPGKRSPVKPDGTKFREYRSNREIGLILKKKLDSVGIKNFFVLDLDEKEDKSLTARANTANEYCQKYGTSNCLFVSLHSNACGNGAEWKENARGWCIYTTKGKTKSDEYATIFYEEAQKLFPEYGMTLRKDMSDGDPDWEENFTVIYKTKCPSVLIEAFFYTSTKDLEFLESKEGKDACAEVVFRGVKRIFKK